MRQWAPRTAPHIDTNRIRRSHVPAPGHAGAAHPARLQLRAEIIVHDPLDEVRHGFTGIALRIVLYFEPEWVFQTCLEIVGFASAVSMGASGDWMNTARFGYYLPEGYALATSDGTLLTAWELRRALPPTVPEPLAPLLMLTAAALLAAASRAAGRRNG